MLIPFATKLDEKTVEALDKVASKTQVPKSRLVAKAIDLLVEHYDQIDQDLAFARSTRQEPPKHILTA